MILDFKEIPQANKGGGHQDHFELFACDFLETIGFNIITRPDRGPDGKKDFIVSEIRIGIGGETILKWMVSCKHYAHSGKAVKDTDEPDIGDRVAGHHCNGFIGFYSTIPASSLSNKLYGNKSNVEYVIYDASRIEKLLLVNNQKERLLLSYFPISHDKYRQQLLEKHSSEDVEITPAVGSLTEDKVLDICKTALIILEIEKIKEEYSSNTWSVEERPLFKLYRYSDHTNAKSAKAVFTFLSSVADTTRSRMHPHIASDIHSLVLTFFPTSYDDTEIEINENGILCTYIAFALAYDAFIYLNNFRIADYALGILKFIYREAKRKQIKKLQQKVLDTYEELENTLNRPERNDLQNAKELVKYYKKDLNSPTLMMPDLPDNLFKLIDMGDIE